MGKIANAIKKAKAWAARKIKWKLRKHTPSGQDKVLRKPLPMCTPDKVRNKLNDYNEIQRVYGPPTDFPQFIRLPLEIRRNIWKASFRGRIVRIYDKINCQRSRKFADYLEYLITFYDSPTPNPVTLSVNHESRTETLRFYHKLFENVETNHSPVYWNPEIDSLAPIIEANHFLRTNRGQWPMTDIWGNDRAFKRMVNCCPKLSQEVHSITIVMSPDWRLIPDRFSVPLSNLRWILDFPQLDEIVFLGGTALTGKEHKTRISRTYLGEKRDTPLATEQEVFDKSFKWFEKNRPKHKLPTIKIFPYANNGPESGYKDELFEWNGGRTYEDPYWEFGARWSDWFESEY